MADSAYSENYWGERWTRNTTSLTASQISRIKELKWFIRCKYNSANNFLKTSGYNKNKLNNVLYGRYEGLKLDEMLNEVIEVARKFESHTKENTLTIDFNTRVWLKHRINANFKNVASFCRLYPEFSGPYLNHVFSGRKKLYCPKIDRLVKILSSENRV